MKKLYQKIVGYAGSASGGVSILGSWQLCHNICLGVIALLAAIGITVVGLPLMFLESISVPVWTMAVLLLGVTGYMTLKKTCMSKKLLMANTGLVIAGVPFKAVQPFILLFWITGALLVAGSIGLAVSDRIKTKAFAKRNKKNTNTPNTQKNTITLLLGIGIVVVLGLILVNTIALVRLGTTANAQITGATVVSTSLFSEFDKQKAHEMMDANNDGMCDTCGMPVGQCMEMGMMECSMGENAKIGLLKSAHVHVDWKVYLNGKQMDLKPFAVPNSDLKKTSRFIHVEEGPAPEKTGDVMHIHAKGVPLSLFFESVGLDFSNRCLSWTDKEYCIDENNTLKFFVNGKQNSEFGEYVPNNGDKILISYGTKNEDITTQLASITDFTHTHYTKGEDEEHEH